MHRHAWLAVAAVVFFSVMTNAAFADNRVALVIGNGAYAHAPHLPNPSHDAEDVAAALKRTGFQTIVGFDLDQAGMQDAAIRFSRAARNADVAVFYYSGHAMQYAGVNYLVPIDAELHDEADLRRMARVDDILGDLQQAKNLRILVLDSCRDNPLADELKRSIGRTRSASIGRGLAKMESPNGTIISYSTQAGGTAMDGDGRNSPYTRAFLKHIEDKEEVSTVFHRISASVYESTSGEQTPELSLSFFGEFYLNGKLQITSATPATPDPCASAESHWKSAEAIGTVDAFQDHLVRFPNCTFAGLAKARIESLNSKVTAITPPTALSPVQQAAPVPSPVAVQRGWIGVRIQPVTAQIADALGLGIDTKGAIVAHLDDGGPAKSAGLAVGDVIVRFDSKSVSEPRELARLVVGTQPGENKEIVILRKSTEIRKMVSVGSHPPTSPRPVQNAQPDRPMPVSPPPGTKTTTVLGLDLANLTDRLREYYNLESTARGVVVTSGVVVTTDKLMSPGDMVLEVSGTAVASVADVQERVEELKKSGKKTALLLVASRDPNQFMNQHFVTLTPQ